MFILCTFLCIYVSIDKTACDYTIVDMMVRVHRNVDIPPAFLHCINVTIIAYILLILGYTIIAYILLILG